MLILHILFTTHLNIDTDLVYIVHWTMYTGQCTPYISYY